MPDTKPHIAIISASVREGRKSHRVALYFKKFIEEKNLATCEIVDLNGYQFPIFNERLWLLKNPGEKVLDFAQRIKNASGVLIVTPEYNGGYPPALKNVIDLLYEEWHHKPIAISTVSNGSFGGSQVITSLQFSLWKIRSIVVPAMFPNPTADKNFSEDGTPVDKEGTDKRATTFINELLWFIESEKRMKS
ncbi:MAG TPA: NAD(P)H-dependent oxidoreductase [Bacteroidia bacterium]|jgi:NAD(P)H-dependent FMN reductase|nr:NAD(P)H-dependent oxidoreductase [Bacteroidia bacterium]